MGNDQTIYLLNDDKCIRKRLHTIYARNDEIEQLADNQVEYKTNFDYHNVQHRQAFHKAKLTLAMFEDSIECVEDHVSLIYCEECHKIVAIVTHSY